MLEHPIKFFERHNLSPRSQQSDALETLHQNWDKYKYFICSLPTGVGKTFISCALADTRGRAYMLTSTLQLQAQYEESWKQIVNLKGRSNYTCNVNSNFTVDAAPCAASKELISSCIKDKICSYYNQKAAALASPAMITNPVYFLYSTHCGFGADVEENPWKKRDVLIMDEAHNMEKHLVSFAESRIEPKRLYDEHGAKTQHIKFTGDVATDYGLLQEIRVQLSLRAAEYAEKLASEFPQAEGGATKSWARGLSDKVAERIRKLNSKIYALDKELQPLNIFFQTHETPEELEERWLMSANLEENWCQLSPMYGNFLFHEYMGRMADKFIFLSATMGSKREFCRELGLKESETLFIETGTPFPPEKSPIIVSPMLNLTYSKMKDNIAKVGPLLDAILTEHEQDRGVIHCATYKLAEEIMRRVSPNVRKRLLTRDMEYLNGALDGKSPKYPTRYNNERLLSMHSSGNVPNSVLLSPSMMEGIDLYDDLSKFQVILKMPWGSLGDPRIKKKAELDRDWYTNQVFTHIMQAAGRSTRHEQDESITYVLDESYPKHLKAWRKNLPAWFLDRHVQDGGS